MYFMNSAVSQAERGSYMFIDGFVIGAVSLIVLLGFGVGAPSGIDTDVLRALLDDYVESYGYRRK